MSIGYTTLGLIYAHSIRKEWLELNNNKRIREKNHVSLPDGNGWDWNPYPEEIHCIVFEERISDNAMVEIEKYGAAAFNGKVVYSHAFDYKRPEGMITTKNENDVFKSVDDDFLTDGRVDQEKVESKNKAIREKTYNHTNKAQVYVPGPIGSKNGQVYGLSVEETARKGTEILLRIVKNVLLDKCKKEWFCKNRYVQVEGGIKCTIIFEKNDKQLRFAKEGDQMANPDLHVKAKTENGHIMLVFEELGISKPLTGSMWLLIDSAN